MTAALLDRFAPCCHLRGERRKLPVPGVDESQDGGGPKEAKSLPPLMRRRVYADFRSEESYFPALFDLILTLYGISFKDPAVAELREKLNPETSRL